MADITKLNEETNDTAQSLIKIARPIFARLGHRGEEWKLSPRPTISFHVYADCAACGKRLRCQKCLVVDNKNQTHFRWEIVVGNYIAVTLTSDTGDKEHNSDTYEKCLCTRFAIML